MGTSPFLNRGKVFDAGFFLQKNIEYNDEGQELFIGYAAPGEADTSAVWLIIKKERDILQKITSERFADGSIEFNKTWSERNSYSY